MFDRIDSLINETISVEGSKLNIGIFWETLEGGDIVNRLYGDPCSMDSWAFLIYNIAPISTRLYRQFHETLNNSLQLRAGIPRETHNSTFRGTKYASKNLSLENLSVMRLKSVWEDYGRGQLYHDILDEVD